MLGLKLNHVSKRGHCKPRRIRLFALIINCTIIMKTKSRVSRSIYAISDRIWCNKHLRHTTTENMLTMGKFDTSDLMMTITWAMDISFQSPKLKWTSWTHTTPYIVMTKVIKRTSSVLDKPPQDKPHKHLHIFNICEHLYYDDNGRQ